MACRTGKRLLTDNRDARDRLAGYLIIQETITGKEFMRILHTVISERSQNAEAEAAAEAAPAEEKAEAVSEAVQTETDCCCLRETVRVSLHSERR